jgi:hypothetical protein
MRPQQERFNDRLEQMLWPTRRHRNDENGRIPGWQEQEFEDLVEVAQRLRTLPQVQTSPDFAGHLEHRMLCRAAELRLPRSGVRHRFCPTLRLRPALIGALACCLLFLVFSTGLLAFAAQVANPTNPLYMLRRLEQHVQISLAGDQSGRAALDLQFAHDSLTALSSLADPAHTQAYEQALADLDQHLQHAALVINTLPNNAHRLQLATELQKLRAGAAHLLRSLLPGLSLAERLETTAQLARLGDTVARVFQGVVTLLSHPNWHAQVSLSGRNLRTGAQLLVDGRLTGVAGTVEQSLLVFALANWSGARHPHVLGILNPDGTVAQTTTITVRLDAGDGNGNNGSNGNGNGNGNGNKPQGTPGAHH